MQEIHGKDQEESQKEEEESWFRAAQQITAVIGHFMEMEAEKYTVEDVESMGHGIGSEKEPCKINQRKSGQNPHPMPCQ